jgi:hypothetical protein
MSVQFDADDYRSIPALAAYINRLKGDHDKVEQRNFRSFVIREDCGDGYHRDVARVRILPDGTIDAPEDFRPTDDEVAAIQAAVATCGWPTCIEATKATLSSLDEIEKAKRGTKFVFFDPTGSKCSWSNSASKPTMAKSFSLGPIGATPSGVAWSRMTTFRSLGSFYSVMIHEGAKKAAHCQWMRDGKTAEAREALAKLPASWAEVIKTSAHLGWVTGAPNPLRTDWTPLRRADKALTLVSDNDQKGEDAAPLISRELRRPLTVVRFGNHFPLKFDLGDAFPETLWETAQSGATRYVGPEYYDCLWPGTWATLEEGRGHRLRDEFIAEWMVSIRPQVFVNKANPKKRYDKEEFNQAVAPYSHALDTARLLIRKQSAQAATLAYEPGQPSGLIVLDKLHVINVYQQSDIRPRPGDSQPWLDYMAHLIPDETDRHETLKWIATLIACSREQDALCLAPGF